MDKRKAAIVLGAVCVLAFNASAAVWRVDRDNVSGTEDGTSWATAFRTIQAAVDRAYSDAGGEVWVAEGAYTSTTNPVAIMKEGVHLYGGFIGLGAGGLETSRDAREWNAHHTVIDGAGHRDCVHGANNVTLDGFTVTRGDSYGMYNSAASPMVSNCTFWDNASYSMRNQGSSPTVTNCTFSDGMNNSSGSSPTVTNCTFSDGMDNSSGSSPTVTNCTLANVSSGAAILNGSGCSPTVTNCALVNLGWDAAMSNAFGSSPTVTNCILWGNDEHGISDDETTSGAVVTYSDVKGGYPGEGNLNVDPLWQNPFREEFRLQAGSPCIDAGTAVAAPNADLVGVARPQGAGHDMGAYEFRDVDGDGMDDTWETEQGLNPGDPGDAVLDPDEDGLTNVQEYGIGTDFRDRADPRRDMYVAPSPTGSNSRGDGSEAKPWATISRAMFETRPHATRISPVTIHLAAGDYSDTVSFVPHVFIAGAGPDLTVVQDYVGYDQPALVVYAAENTGIRDCTITFSDVRRASMLVEIDGVAMTLENVVLDGGDILDSLGILVSGRGSSGSVVRNCVIRALGDGIHAVDSGIAITRNLFDGIDEDAIFVALSEEGAKADKVTPHIGDVTDGQSGFNEFRFIEGLCVKNWSGGTVKAELNDWGVYTEAEIAQKVSPGVDFVPFLGGETAPASLSGQVLDAGTSEPIPLSANPVVRAGEAVTQPDEHGHYSFASLAPGDTTVSVTAREYRPATRYRTLAQGEDAVESFSLEQHTYAPTDFDQDDQTNAIDVQLVINQALDIPTGYDCDVNGDGNVDAVDIQLVINAALGL